MNKSDSEDQISEEIINLLSDDYSYMDSSDNWLSEDPNETFTINNSNEDIISWIRSFSNEKTRANNSTLVKKLDELKLTSPSIDSRTFTRKRNLQKRQTFLNGGMSSLCSPVNEDENSSPEIMDKTFEVQIKKSLNDTFTANKGDTTFTLSNDEDIQLNNMVDIEKIAKQQEDSLRQDCSNGWATNNRSFTRNQSNRMNATINSNTLTKCRDPNKYARIEAELNSYHINGDDKPYENGLSPEDSFRANMSTYTTSTPLVSKYTNLTHEIREPIVPKIMPEVVTNLKTNSSYSRSKVGRSEPNLSQRLQPLSKGLGFNATRSQTMTNKMGNPLTNNTLRGKVSSDSRLLLNNGLRLPQNHNVGRVTSPPPSLSQQQLLLNRKVAVEGELNRLGTTTANTTNLCRKSTFRVRDYAMNSEENLKESEYELCLTNTSASTNGYKTNKTNNNKVHKNVSKIPGPKSIRSGIPVSGQRTAIPCPINRPNNQTENWSNGCY